jgi:hypothetical protein
MASKEIGLEVNADKTEYMVMSRDQHAGRSHGMKIDNTTQQKKNLGFLVFRPVPGVIWGADSEKCIG